MTTTGDQHMDVFVSYSHADTDSVLPLISRLKNQGIRLWYDEGIQPGSSWSDELADKVLQAKILLFLVTKNSASSQHCIAEIGFALDNNITVLPVYLEATEMPKGMQLRLNTFQAILKYELTESQFQSRLLMGIREILQTSAPIIEQAEPHQDGSRRWLWAAAAIAVVALLWVAVALIDQPETTTETVQNETDAGDRAMPPQVAETVPDNPSIAVLPFVNMSSDPEQEYFGDGLAEDILNGLVKIPGLTVKARTSSFAFKGKNLDIRDIGAQLQAKYILEGSVRKSGNSIRVTAQLIETREDRHIWSEQYDHNLIDVFQVQDEITKAILAALNVHLLASQKAPAAVNFAAYDARMKAYFHMGRLEYDRAKSFLQQAIEYDPMDATSPAGLANLHSLDVWFGRATIPEKLPIIQRYINQALTIDPNETTARAVRAGINFYVNGQYQDVINEINALIHQYPGDTTLLGSYRGYMITIGRPEEGLKALDHILEADPMAADVHRVRGETLEHMGRFTEASDAYLQARELGIDVGDKMASVAISSAHIPSLESLRDRVSVTFGADDLRYRYLTIQIARLTGDRATYLRELETVKQIPTPSRTSTRNFAMLEEDWDTAIETIRAELNLYFPRFWLLAGSAGNRMQYPELFAHPEYVRLQREVGLDEESTNKIIVPPLPF